MRSIGKSGFRFSAKSKSGFPNRTRNPKTDPKNLDLDFLIEIHPEDGFLGGEISASDWEIQI